MNSLNKNNTENSKQLYLLHIPKTGGTSVAATLRHSLDQRSLKWHKNCRPPHAYSFSEFVFIDAHLGFSEQLVTKSTSVACLLRNPVDRAVSNFLWIHDSVLAKQKRYSQIEKIENRLRVYLFEDEEYLPHRNIQSKFICNSVDKSVFDSSFSFSYEDYSKTWFIKQDNVTIDSLISKLNTFEIVGTTEKHDYFLSDIVSWFLENYKIYVDNFHIEHAIKSQINYNEAIYETRALVDLLSNKEYDTVIELNQVDFAAYEYISKRQVRAL